MTTYTLSVDKPAGFTDTTNYFTIATTGSVEGTGVGETLESSIYNFGKINAGNNPGVFGISLSHAGYVHNETQGKIYGYNGIQAPNGTSTGAIVTNNGTISASNNGIEFRTGGYVTNNSNGLINGTKSGIYITGGDAHIRNNGVIGSFANTRTGINTGTGTVLNYGNIVALR